MFFCLFVCLFSFLPCTERITPGLPLPCFRSVGWAVNRGEAPAGPGEGRGAPGGGDIRVALLDTMVSLPFGARRLNTQIVFRVLLTQVLTCVAVADTSASVLV